MTQDDESTPSRPDDAEVSAEGAEGARKGGLSMGAIVAIAVAGVVVLVIAGLGIYDIVHDDPAAPTLSEDEIFAATAPECEDLGFHNDRAMTCRAAFYLGAVSAWDEDEHRWLSSDELEAEYDTHTAFAMERPQRLGLTAEQVADELPWLGGFFSGASWLKDEAEGG